MKSIDVHETYEGIPAITEIKDMAVYIQPWSGYIPPCHFQDCNLDKHFPCQTSNIKVKGVYDEVEVESNKWIELACQEAKESVEEGMGPFGAVIVQIDDESGHVIRYWKNHNHVTGDCDPTAHAEITAIRTACSELGVFNLGKINKDEAKLPQRGEYSHCEIYSSCEPCPMCMSAIYWAKIPVVVFAATRYDASQQGLGFQDEELFIELQKAYKDRKIRIYQASCPNSLDAFNLWKRVDKIHY